MDILTDILNSAGLTTKLITKHSFFENWAMKFPCNRSMGFHLVTQGTAYIRFDKQKEPLVLNKGDLIMVKRGLDHEVATSPTAKIQNLPAEVLLNSKMPTHKKEKPILTLVGGLYQFQTEPIHPLFAEIPNYIIFRADEIPTHSPLFMAQQLLTSEIEDASIGSDSISKNLIDVLFHYIFRTWLANKPEKKLSWSMALKDEHLQKALSAMHSKPSHSWDLEELASIAGISRATLAVKFKKITGDTPAHYLTKIRIQHSMELLRTSNDNLDKIAESVGYGDSFIFSKAFKRTLGISPKEYRKKIESQATSA